MKHRSTTINRTVMRRGRGDCCRASPRRSSSCRNSNLSASSTFYTHSTLTLDDECSRQGTSFTFFSLFHRLPSPRPTTAPLSIISFPSHPNPTNSFQSEQKHHHQSSCRKHENPFRGFILFFSSFFLPLHRSSHRSLIQ